MEPDQGIGTFDEFRNQLAQTLNPNMAKEQTKQLIGNILLMFGVQFFLNRLEKHLDKETVEKIKEIIKDPSNAVNKTKELATQLFKDKVLEPVKTQVLNEASKYVPELRNIDFENASLEDVTNAFQKSVISKMKENLPAEIADKLPENFTREDILNSIKDIGSDQALAFAKKQLPPEVYSKLEANKELIRDPAKIGGFIRENIDNAQESIKIGVNKAKEAVQAKVNEATQALSNKFEEQVKPFKDAVENLKTQKASLADKWQEAQNELNGRFETARQVYKDYVAANPGASEEDLAPLRNAWKNVRQEARDQRTAFQTGSSDLDEQINNAQQLFESKSNELLETFSNLKNTATERVNAMVSQGKQAFDDTVSNVKQTGQKLAEPILNAKQEAQKTAADLESSAKATIAEGEGMLSSVKKGASKFMGGVREKLSSFVNPTSSEPTPATGGHGYSLLDPLELTEGYTEQAISKVSRNPVLQSFFGSELDKPETILAPKQKITKITAPADPERDAITSKIAKLEGARSPMAEQEYQGLKTRLTEIDKPPTTRRPKLRSTQPQFTDQEEAQRTFASGGTKPVEVLPKIPKAGPGDEPAAKPSAVASVSESIADVAGTLAEGSQVAGLAGAIKSKSKSGIAQSATGLAATEAQKLEGPVGVAGELVGEGLGLAGLGEAIKSKNKGAIAQAATQQGLTEAQRAAQFASKPSEIEPAPPGATPETAPIATKATTTSTLSPEAAAQTGGEEAAAQTEEQVAKTAASQVAKTAGEEAAVEGLDTAAAATSEIPVLGTIIDVAGLLGSIFGAGALMKTSPPPTPIMTGSSYEPGL